MHKLINSVGIVGAVMFFEALIQVQIQSVPPFSTYLRILLGIIFIFFTISMNIMMRK